MYKYLNAYDKTENVPDKKPAFSAITSE